MCSFLIYNFPVLQEVLEKINAFLKLRGPDNTNVYTHGDYTFVHNLIHLTGEVISQPYVQGSIVAVFDGSIYNYKEFDSAYKSEGECLIPLYKKYGSGFTSHLHGEFAVVLFDFEKKIFIISSDIYRTKPLYYGNNGKRFGIASWPLPLKQLQLTNIQRIEMNAALTFNMNTLMQIKRNTIYTYDLRQYKTSYDDLLKAIEYSIKVRSESSHLTPFITLSSGYDSGAIACELLAQQKKCNYISLMTALEDMNVLEKRFELNTDGEKILIKRQGFDINNYKYILDIYNQNFGITAVSKNMGDPINVKTNISEELRNDKLASSFLFHTAMKNNYKLHLSGLGGDTVFSDLSKRFPVNLADVIPKTTTDKSTQWNKFWDHGENPRREEFFASMFGIQTRYPFIDKYVVQEFLNLDVDLKNKYYKAPLRVYLENHKYPFALGKKAGLWINT